MEWVIFDEVHYVNDADRGVVWEEVLFMIVIVFACHYSIAAGDYHASRACQHHYAVSHRYKHLSIFDKLT